MSDFIKFTDILKNNFRKSLDAKRKFLEQEKSMQDFHAVAAAVVQAYKNGGRLYIAGNGGSAADAQHLAAEFVSKLCRDRNPMPAEALTVDSSILTAIGNDYGYEHVFSRQILGKMSPRDVFLGITTSGNSLNILKALEVCKTMGITSVLFSGRDGGKAKALADFCVIASGENTAVIQELHLVIAHSLCEVVEQEIMFKPD
jgi:D-sedoheptulose 7-phosphate isomerase